MKRLILLIVAVFFSFTTFGQNTQVIVNGQSNQTVGQDYSYYINGISSKEDIGGVSTRTAGSSNENSHRLYLKNSNSFPVTVVWEAETYSRGTRSGTVTLNKGEEKQVLDMICSITSVKTITRKISNGIDVTTELTKYKDLLDRGIITQEEFNALKKKLLDL